MTSTQVLAYQASDVKPGWVAFIIVLALIAGTLLLWRSMNTQLRKIKAPTREELRQQNSDSATGSASQSGGEQADSGEPGEGGDPAGGSDDDTDTGRSGESNGSTGSSS
ncbi:MAG: hypothetical protein ACRDP4_03265 [Nocardioidaceae bacterium]